MAALHLLLLLLFTVYGESSGVNVTRGANVTVYAPPGGSVLLQINDTEWAQCGPEHCGLDWKKNGTQALVKQKTPNTTSCSGLNNCRVSINGSLELSRISASHAGSYSAERYRGGKHCYTKWFEVQVQDPVSTPEVNYTCRPNARVQLSCRVANGTDPSYSWSLDETPAWNSTGDKETGYPPVRSEVNCTAKNQISEERSDSIRVTCPDPVSKPEVSSTCLPGGSIKLSCLVKESNVSYSWRVNGTETEDKHSEITVHGLELFDVTCTVGNNISKNESDAKNVTCLAPVSEAEVIFTCLNGSSVNLSCLVVNGTDPFYSWSVNGSKTEFKTVNITVLGPVHFNVTCTAKNQMSERESQPINVTCLGSPTAVSPASSPTTILTGNSTKGNLTARGCVNQLRCVWRAVIGGTVAFVVASVPLVLGCLYTMPRKNSLR